MENINPMRERYELLFTGLAAIYRAADAAVAAIGGECRACGRCCRFREYGHVLYATNYEVLYALRDIRRIDGVRATPDGCPMQQGVLCTARERRLLGCRTFHCDREKSIPLEDAHNRLLMEIRTLAEKTGIPCEYAPFHELFEKYGNGLPWAQEMQ